MSNLHAFNFPESAVTAFTEGDCWVLAHAIHEIAGWEVVALGDKASPDVKARYRGWVHILNRHPNGDLVDITGIYTEGQMLSSWKHLGTTFFNADDKIYVIDQDVQYEEDMNFFAQEIIDACEKVYADAGGELVFA